jgi:hypothetical protein
MLMQILLDGGPNVTRSVQENMASMATRKVTSDLVHRAIWLRARQTMRTEK